MSLNTKNDERFRATINFVPVTTYNKKCADYEKQELMISIKNRKIENQSNKIGELNEKIESQNTLIKDMEREIQDLKANQESNMIIRQVRHENDRIKEVYGVIYTLLSDEHDSITEVNPKAAVAIINEAQSKIKQLHNRVYDNEMMVKELCNVLDCQVSEMMPKLKKTIHDSEQNKKEAELLKDFFTRELHETKNRYADLYSTGALAKPVKVDVKSNRDPISDWGMRVINRRISNHKKSLTSNDRLPTFKVHDDVPKMDHNNRVSRWGPPVAKKLKTTETDESEDFDTVKISNSLKGKDEDQPEYMAE